MKNYIYFEVALPLPFYTNFTYKINKEKYEKLKNKDLIGRRVLVPFRNSGYTGIILNLVEEVGEYQDFEIREIEEIPDDEPVFTEKEIKIAKKISNYYITPVGITLYYFLPEGLRWKKKSGKWYKKFPESYVYRPVPKKEKLTNIQKELYELIVSQGEITEIEILELGFTKSTINALIKKGFLKKESTVFTNNIETLKKEPKYEKVEIKKAALFYGGRSIANRLKFYENLFKTFQKENKSSILVFPNITSLKKAYQILSQNLPDVYMYHDGINQKENVKNWFKLKNKGGNVLLTSYSGLLIPVKNLSCLIIEEESSDSYKTLRAPKFDVRRVAYEIYREKNLSIIYGGYAPSIESYYSIKKSIIKPLTDDYLDIKKSSIVKVYPFKREEIFSKTIIDILKEEKKTLIIANKKAYASFLYCPRCEDEILCEKCDIPLKVYKKYLQCDLCKTKYELIEKCPICETNLQIVGTGIEKIEEILKENFEVSYLFEEKNTKIKIATTIVDKEIAVPDFERVINIYPDFYLNIQDYKGREKFFKNILYSYIKAKEEFILITNNINEIAVRAVIENRLKDFYEDELKKREKFSYPPFHRYILLTFEKKKLDINFLNELFKLWLKEYNLNNIKYKGIFKGFHQKIKGKERAQVILIDFKERKALIDLYEKCRKLGIKLIMDIDPVQLY